MTPCEKELSVLLKEVVPYVADRHFVFGSKQHWDRQALMRRIRVALKE